MTKFLDDEKFYMFTPTGNVQTGEDIEGDFEEYLKNCQGEIFKTWCGRDHTDESLLTEVEKNKNGEWEEVE